MNKGKVIITVIAVFVGVIGLILGLQVGGVEWYKFIGPKRESARRSVYKQTTSYNESKVQDLVRFRVQYIRAKTPEDKHIITSTIRMMYADFNPDKIVNDDLRVFLIDVLNGSK